ncbi:MAG: PKD domain-containing protein [Candidatus Saccharibacteria bacterium]
MFKQIVSSLSMSPQAASQLTFYARRLKQESVTRFFSAFAAVLLVLLQVVTVVSPASASNSSNVNDLIPGGYSKKADLLATYDSPGSATLRIIYTRFGVTRADIASSNTVMTRINSRDQGNTLKSVGHTPYGFAGEVKVALPTSPVSYVYARNLSAFDTGSNVASGSYYDALVGKRASDGGYFAILVVCGNIVVKTIPPGPDYACAKLTPVPVQGQAPLAVKLTATATVSGGAQIATYIFDFGDGTPKLVVPTNKLSWGPVVHTYTAAKIYKATVGVTSNISTTVKTATTCAATITATTKPTTTPTPTITPAQCKPGVPVGSPLCESPTLACVSLTGTPASGTAPLQVAFTSVGSATNQTITDYQYDFGDGTTANSSSTKATHSYKTSGPYTATLTVKGSNGGTATAPACQFSINVADIPPVFENSKTALNMTQNTDATKSTAKGGDIIKYSLITKNSGGAAGDYITTDDLADILEYSTITDNGGGTVAGTSITWPSDTINAGQTITHTFTMTVKNPVPLTATGISNPRSFDLNMDNVFGNPVRVPVEAPPSKQIETASATMPQTGPGTSIMIMLFIGGMIFFFYLRNRQLVAEIKILRNEYHGEASHVS